MTTDDSSQKPGTLVGGRYRLIEELARGGMGRVWLAKHETLHTEVALKFFAPVPGVSRTEIASRFEQEATSAAKIKSPHVVRILDYGVGDDGAAYIAMERLSGVDLATRLQEDNTLTISEVGQLVTQTCRGLVRAHREGVVHRDIKPENLFLSDEDDEVVVKILDFGIAKATRESPSAHRTGAGRLLGTPAFMSPEQARGGAEIDARTDLFSLAVVAYRALTGRMPWPIEPLGTLLIALATEEAPAPSTINPALPPELDEFFRVALAKNPEDRYPSAHLMSVAFAQSCGISLRQPSLWDVSSTTLSRAKLLSLAAKEARADIASQPTVSEETAGSDPNVNVSLAAARSSTLLGTATVSQPLEPVRASMIPGVARSFRATIVAGAAAAIAAVVLAVGVVHSSFSDDRGAIPGAAVASLAQQPMDTGSVAAPAHVEEIVAPAASIDPPPPPSADPAVAAPAAHGGRKHAGQVRAIVPLTPTTPGAMKPKHRHDYGI